MTQKVFAFVAYGMGEPTWNDKFQSGKMIGINEPYAYGYHLANEMGCTVRYSHDHPESRLMKLVRQGIRAFCGFDVLHAWRNRKVIRQSDAVWTHTESQSLGAVLMLLSIPKASRPVLILQSVWLIDKWPKLSWLHKFIFKRLLSHADVLTFHSELNTEQARNIFPDTRVERVLFGIDCSKKRPPRHMVGDTIRVLSLGNDRHRDWATLVQALDGMQGVECKILSQTCPKRLVEQSQNIRLETVQNNEELNARFDWADICIIPLIPNLHASGATVSQEAALQGKPCIISDVGGLRDSYFGDEAVKYVSSRSAGDLKAAVQYLKDYPERSYDMAVAAQARMSPEGLSSFSFVRTHVALTRDVLAGRTREPEEPLG